MASITIRKLDDEVRTLLQAQAARNNHSMEEEARLILRNAVSGKNNKSTSLGVFEISQEIFGPENGVELELPPRDVAREPPRFD